MKLNKLLIPAYFFLLLFTIQPVSFAQQNITQWIMPTMGTGGSISNWSITTSVPDKRSRCYPVSMLDQTDSVQISALTPNNNPLTNPDVQGKESSTAICGVGDQIASLPDLAGAEVSTFFNLNDGAICKEDNSQKPGQGGSTTFTFLAELNEPNIKIRCLSDEYAIGRVRYCYPSTNREEDCVSFNELGRNLSCIPADFNSNSCDSWVACQGKKTNTIYDGRVAQNRNIFCLPSEDKKNSRTVVCSKDILVSSNYLQETDYQIAKKSLSLNPESFEGICKYASDYQLNQTLKGTISEEAVEGNLSCSLQNIFDQEISNSEKLKCGNPGDCESTGKISLGTGVSIYCIGNNTDSEGQKYVCLNSYTTNRGTVSAINISVNSYNSARDAISFSNTSSSVSTTLSDEKPCILQNQYTGYVTSQGTIVPLDRNVTRILPLGYTLILRNVSQVLYATAVFLFVLLMIINGIHLVRSGDNPEELKKAKEGIFRTIAGFLFVLFSGGFIISIINSMQQINP